MTRTRVGVIGLGLIGGSIAQRLARLPDHYAVAGFDNDGGERPGVELMGSLEQVATAAELVVIALPPQHTAAAVTEVLAANADALVMDVASVKAPVLEQVSGDLDRFLPSHPLAGAEGSGWDSARPDLLDATTWAVCPPHASAPAELLCRWAAMLELFDARLIVCDPAEHDAAVARTSHAPHLAASVIAASLANGEARLAAALSGGAFRDMTRIARSDPALWTGILQLNREDVAAVLDEWIAGLEELRGTDSTANWERGRSMVELVEQLRWHAPAWEERSFDWPAWDELLALGREGRAVRRLSVADGRLAGQVSAPPG